MNETKITVVVCAKNEEKYIENCLKCLSAQAKKPEIIIIDGHSTDNTLKIAKNYADKILQDTGKGLHEARNIGWQNASGNVVAYCDADCLPKRDWTKNILALMKNYDCVSGPLNCYDSSWLMKAEFKFWADWFPRFLSIFNYNSVWGANMSFKKQVLKKYPFRLKFLEDYDIGYRLRRNKIKMKFSSRVCMHASSRRFKKGFHRTAFRFYVLKYIKIKLFGKYDRGYF